VFNIGGGEILMILIVALVFLGPERLPTAARDIGRMIAKFKNLTSGVQSEFRDALQADELREGLAQVRSVLDIKQQITAEITGLASSLTNMDPTPATPTPSAQPATDTEPMIGAGTDVVATGLNAGFDPARARELVGVQTPEIPPPDGIFADDLPIPHPMAMDMSIPNPDLSGSDVFLHRGYGESAVAMSAGPKSITVVEPATSDQNHGAADLNDAMSESSSGSSPS
jgi:sec-independent protein translocase protein TatB